MVGVTNDTAKDMRLLQLIKSELWLRMIVTGGGVCTIASRKCRPHIQPYLPKLLASTLIPANIR